VADDGLDGAPASSPDGAPDTAPASSPDTATSDRHAVDEQ
jgi:hypothetical protein